MSCRLFEMAGAADAIYRIIISWSERWLKKEMRGGGGVSIVLCSFMREMGDIRQKMSWLEM